MILLAVDTATHSCSVAVVADGVIRAEATVVTRETHSKHLMSLIAKTLSIAHCDWGDVDGMAVSLGPGTFTGLRIGLATVKGLATALDKPLAGVSTLEALAWQAGPRSEIICSSLDARRQQVYYGIFKYHAQSRLEPLGPLGVASIETVLAQVSEPCLFIGNGAEVYADRLLFDSKKGISLAPGPHNILRAASIGFLADQQVTHSGWDDMADLVPIYLRKSDAELKFGHDSDLPIVMETLPTLES